MLLDHLPKAQLLITAPGRLLRKQNYNLCLLFPKYESHHYFMSWGGVFCFVVHQTTLVCWPCWFGGMGRACRQEDWKVSKQQERGNTWHPITWHGRDATRLSGLSACTTSQNYLRFGTLRTGFYSMYIPSLSTIRSKRETVYSYSP